MGKWRGATLVLVKLGFVLVVYSRLGVTFSCLLIIGLHNSGDGAIQVIMLFPAR